MESAFEEALNSLRDSRAELQEIKNELKEWRKNNPKDQLNSGQGGFLYNELLAARKREETSQKTFQVLLKSMKNFQHLGQTDNLNSEGKRQRDNDVDSTIESEKSNEKKMKLVGEIHHSMPKILQERAKKGESDSSSSIASSSGSESTSSDESSKGSDSSDNESSESSDSDNSSSSSSEDSESSSDSNSDSSKNIENIENGKAADVNSSFHVREAHYGSNAALSHKMDSKSNGKSNLDSEVDSNKKIETLKENIQLVKIPGNLTKSKRNAVRRMIDMPVVHHYFEEELPEILDSNRIPFQVQPFVKYSETYLYNPENISLSNSKRKNKKQNGNHQTGISESVEKGSSKEKNVSIDIDYNSLDVYSEKKPPPEGTTIVFKRLELSNAYTPELSGWRKGIIRKVDIDFDGTRTRHIVSIQLAEVSDEEIEPKVGWEPKVNQLQFGNQTKGKFEIEDEYEMVDGDLDQDCLAVDWSSLLEVRILSN